MAFVVFVGDGEVIVTTEKREKETYEVFFQKGGRHMEVYDRTVVSDVGVLVQSILRAS